MIGRTEVDVVTLDLALVVVEEREAFVGQLVERNREDRGQRISYASCTVGGADQSRYIRLREELGDLVGIVSIGEGRRPGEALCADVLRRQ